MATASPDHRVQPVYRHPNQEFSGKLIVAVHGMGDQTRNGSAQDIARLFARHFTKGCRDSAQATLLPLGAWDGGNETSVDDPAVCFCPRHGSDADQNLADHAFAEVYWADIARGFEKEGYRLEDPTHWAVSVVDRISQRYGGDSGFAPRDMHLAHYVIEEITETLTVLRYLSSLGQLGKLSRAQVDDVLLKYLCDVQQVGDFVRQREKIRLRFINRMSVLQKRYPKAKIHLITHSEGAAVALYSILSALDPVTKGQIDVWRNHQNGRISDPKLKIPAPTWDWVQNLHSFTTLGSPIDKHLLLWPEMWTNFHSATEWRDLPRTIRWRNYYDLADPVGFKLDTAREFITDQTNKWNCRAFDFPKEGDHGFRRYPIPGKAHVDYFTDDTLFSFIIENSIAYDPSPTQTPAIHSGPKSAHGTPTGNSTTPSTKPDDKAPGSRALGYMSRVLPFLMVAFLLLAAVFVFMRGISVNATAQAADRPAIDTGVWSTLRFAALLAGTTVLARIVRLSRALWMRLLALGIYAAGVALYLVPFYLGTAGDGICKPLGAVLCSAIIVAIGLFADYFAVSRKLRPVWALRLMLLISGILLLFVIALPRLADADKPSASAVIGGWAGFMGLWWIAILLFDLAYCWQRYINVSYDWVDRVRNIARNKAQ